jgi:hypothetical protein
MVDKKLLPTGDRQEEDETLENFSEKYAKQHLEYADEFKILDDLNSRGKLNGFFDSGVFIKDGLSPTDKTKAIEALRFLAAQGEIEMGIILKDDHGNLLTRTFNEGFSSDWPEIVVDNEGANIPARGLEIAPACRLK